METNYFEEEKPQIVIDETGKSYMLETARWAKFLAVIGFVFMGLLLLGALSLAYSLTIPSFRNELGNFGGAGVIGLVIFYVLLLLIFFYPMYALLKFANLIKGSMVNMNQQLFDEAFRFLKNTFKFWGIYTIIMVIIWGLYIIFMITLAATASAS